jgi:hypothetical protein
MSTVGETIDGLRGGGRGWTLLVIAVGWLFISGFRVVLPALLSTIKADFAVDNASAGFALTVLWLTYAGLQFPSDLVADRIGIGPLASAFIVRELPASVQGSGWGLLRTVFFGIGATGSTVIGVLAALTGLTTLFWLAIPAERTDGG